MKTIKWGKLRLQPVLEMLIELTYLAIFLAIPLAMAWFLPTDNVFELNKIVVFRSLVYVLFVLTLIKALFFSSRQKISRRYIYPALALLIFGVIALSFSTNPSNSYQGLSDRQQGYRTLLFYVWWFFLLFYNLATSDNLEKRLNRIFWVIMGSSFLVCLYGILQILGIDFIAWTEPPFVTHRATSTLGQPNYLGSYLLLVIPLTVYGLIHQRSFWPRFLLSILLLSQLVTLVITGSRAAWLGLLGALVLSVIWGGVRLRLHLSAPKRRGLLLISILTVIITIFFLSRSSYLVNRFESMTDFSRGSVSARFNFWSGALKSIAHKPLLGYGLENQGDEFIKYYQVNWAQSGFVNATTNRAHNLILDLLLTVGIIGLGFYVWVYTSFFSWANRVRRDERYRLLAEALIAAVLGLLISLLFGFSVIVTEVYFWAYLALVAAILAQLDGGQGGDFQVRLKGWIKALIIVLALAFSGYQVSLEFKALVADNYFMEMRQVLAQTDYPKALFYYQKIKEQGAADFNYTYYLIDALPYDLQNNISPVIVNLIQKELTNVLPRLTEESYDSFYLKAKIHTLLHNYDAASGYYQKIIDLSPELPKNYLARAKFYELEQKDDLALADLAKTLTLLPTPQNTSESLTWAEKSVAFYQSLIFQELGGIYFREQKYDLAEKNYRSAYRLNLNDLASYKKIADTYFMRDDLATAIWYNLRAFERHPNDFVWPYSIALLYNQAGDHSSALKYLNQAVVLDASHKIPTEIIESIKNPKVK